MIINDINGSVINEKDQFYSYEIKHLCTVKEINNDGMIVIYGSVTHVIFFEDLFSRRNFPSIIKVHTWKELAKFALSIQDSSNLKDVMNSFATVAKEISFRLESEKNCKITEMELASHPIIVLFADKINSMIGHENIKTEAVNSAFGWASQITKS